MLNVCLYTVAMLRSMLNVTTMHPPEQALSPFSLWVTVVET